MTTTSKNISSLNLSREEAYKLLFDNLSQTKQIIGKDINTAFCTYNFLDHLVKKNLMPEKIRLSNLHARNKWREKNRDAVAQHYLEYVLLHMQGNDSELPETILMAIGKLQNTNSTSKMPVMKIQETNPIKTPDSATKTLPPIENLPQEQKPLVKEILSPEKNSLSIPDEEKNSVERTPKNIFTPTANTKNATFFSPTFSNIEIVDNFFNKPDFEEHVDESSFENIELSETSELQKKIITIALDTTKEVEKKLNDILDEFKKETNVYTIVKAFTTLSDDKIIHANLNVFSMYEWAVGTQNSKGFSTLKSEIIDHIKTIEQSHKNQVGPKF